MTKEIEIHGQRVQVYSLDKGQNLVEQPPIDRCLWTKKIDAALELQKRFERLDAMQDYYPNDIAELGIPRSFKSG